MAPSEHLRAILMQHLNTEVLTCEFDRKGYPMTPDTRPDASWRDHLLRTFSVRLRLAEQHNSDACLIQELKRFISALEALDRTADLYCWQARTDSGYFGGWATADRIIYATRSNNDER
jgi:hypothetical protein